MQLPSCWGKEMRTASVIFNQMTALDFIGIYDPITGLKSMQIIPEFMWEVCAFTDEVSDDRGLRFKPRVVAEPLYGYDLVIVPGGFGTRALQRDAAFIEWLRSARPAKLKVSVCTGSFLLGAAGFLTGKNATTHPSAFEKLKPYCARVVDWRVVDEGEVVTARSVTSAIDLGLYLVERLAGGEAMARVARQMDYPYRREAAGQV